MSERDPAALSPSVSAAEAPAERLTITVWVNGQAYTRTVPARLLLVDFLRNELGLTGTHIGCDTSTCGACTVHVDGRSVKACTMFAVQADGRAVRTVEGLAHPTEGGPGERELHPLQQAFHEAHALQCGYCTPGMLMSALYLLEHNPNPTRDEIKRAIAGNLCRCTGYHFIIDAIELAAARMRQQGDR
ncbi:MAG TPA: (2Fe-2S)-binding protein [Chloroflexota bacterium]|nr:(2Fe-2S)-binding protein [Chloroflexota bacterium]